MSARKPVGEAEAAVRGYRNTREHLRDELRKLDLLIRKSLLRFRARFPERPGAAEFRFNCITHEEVDGLLTAPESAAPEAPEAELARLDAEIQRLEEQIGRAVRQSRARRVVLGLPRLGQLFGLSPFELQVVLVCLAPELRRKYDKLYAYLQDDITRKRPSIDLALELLCGSEDDRWQARSHFADEAPLFRSAILRKLDDPHSPSGSTDLAKFLRLDPRIRAYILGDQTLDGALVDMAERLIPGTPLDQVTVAADCKAQLARWLDAWFQGPVERRKPLLLHLYGPAGVGKRELVLGLCERVNCPLLCLDLEALQAQGPNWPDTLRLVFREALLQQAALLISGIDRWRDPGDALAKHLARLTASQGWLTVVAGTARWQPEDLPGPVVFHALEIPYPEADLRQSLWAGCLRDAGEEGRAWASTLSERFRLTPGQIRAAAAWAEQRQTMAGRPLELKDLCEGSRRQSQQALGELGVRLEPQYGWEDIVLPPKPLGLLQAICHQVKHRHRVFGEWGFGRRLSHGRGLSALFSGPPGTGKTLAAEVIAHELELDLYKIDLSGVVSKYIGETEKNLGRIFREAEHSNAILFFDEADALFGKRTQVSDAHDRYANIEVSYLLQKMEDYEGMVILATNLRENLDEAFVRRLRFIVEFPFPDAPGRSEIWRLHFPKAAPVAADIDCEWLGKQFPIAGGNIRNIVLNAAFLAAGERGTIGMPEVLEASRQEYGKLGKLWEQVVSEKGLSAK